MKHLRTNPSVLRVSASPLRAPTLPSVPTSFGQEFLYAGGDPNMRDSTYLSPLHNAAIGGSPVRVVDTYDRATSRHMLYLVAFCFSHATHYARVFSVESAGGVASARGCAASTAEGISAVQRTFGRRSSCPFLCLLRFRMHFQSPTVCPIIRVSRLFCRLQTSISLTRELLFSDFLRRWLDCMLQVL